MTGMGHTVGLEGVAVSIDGEATGLGVEVDGKELGTG